MPTSYTVTIEHDNETRELVLPIPQELMDQVGWKPGDTLIWKQLSNNSFCLITKSENSETA